MERSKVIVLILLLTGCAQQSKEVGHQSILISEGCLIQIEGLQGRQAEEVMKAWEISPGCDVNVYSSMNTERLTEAVSEEIASSTVDMLEAEDFDKELTKAAVGVVEDVSEKVGEEVIDIRTEQQIDKLQPPTDDD